jgi:hypothetical protein
MSGPTVYRLWNELTPPLGRVHWWLLDHHLLGWPGKRAWLGKAVAGVQAIADEHGLTLIGDAIPGVVDRNGRVSIVATALAEGPPGLADYEHGPVDIVDLATREEGDG